MTRKRVLVVCGTAGITSTVAEREIMKAAASAGIDVQTIKLTPHEARLRANEADLIVSMTALQGDFGIPLINGISFVTGLGKAETIKRIVDELKK
ncbi:MAG: PTS galactitol transporter subunit IIB [Bacillota bacterium]